MINKIKLILWKYGLLKTNICPICKDKLIKQGFPNDYGSQRYYCMTKKCKFNR